MASMEPKSSIFLTIITAFLIAGIAHSQQLPSIIKPQVPNPPIFQALGTPGSPLLGGIFPPGTPSPKDGLTFRFPRKDSWSFSFTVPGGGGGGGGGGSFSFPPFSRTPGGLSFPIPPLPFPPFTFPPFPGTPGSWFPFPPGGWHLFPPLPGTLGDGFPFPTLPRTPSGGFPFPPIPGTPGGGLPFPSPPVHPGTPGRFPGAPSTNSGLSPTTPQGSPSPLSSSSGSEQPVSAANHHSFP